MVSQHCIFGIFLMFIKIFQRKIIFRKYLYFIFELKVISLPEQIVQLPVIKIFNFSGLFSKHQRKLLFFFKIFFKKSIDKGRISLETSSCNKRSRLFQKDLYIYNEYNCVYTYIISLLWIQLGSSENHVNPNRAICAPK